MAEGLVTGVQESSRQLAIQPLTGAPLSSGPDGRDGVHCWEQMIAMDTVGKVTSGPPASTQEKAHFNPSVALFEPGLETLQEAK